MHYGLNVSIHSVIFLTFGSSAFHHINARLFCLANCDAKLLISSLAFIHKVTLSIGMGKFFFQFFFFVE